MSLDLAFLLALSCVWLARATGRMVAELPGLAVEFGGEDVPAELLHALERGLTGFRRWVLAAPFCWLVAAWASNHPALPASANLAMLAEGAGLFPIVGVLLSTGAGLWRFSAAASAAQTEGGAERFGHELSAVLLSALSALSFAVAIGASVMWIRSIL